MNLVPFVIYAILVILVLLGLIVFYIDMVERGNMKNIRCLIGIHRMESGVFTDASSDNFLKRCRRCGKIECVTFVSGIKHFASYKNMDAFLMEHCVKDKDSKYSK